MSQETIYFGAGCFWGVEEAYRTFPGVVETAVGYMGGKKDTPSYEEVCADNTGHAEVVKVVYDSNIVAVEALIQKFWKIHDPTEVNKQGPDHGTQYRTVIFTTTDEQTKIAEQSKKALDESGLYSAPIATEIRTDHPAFWPAEEYHQKYLMKRGKNVCHI